MIDISYSDIVNSKWNNHDIGTFYIPIEEKYLYPDGRIEEICYFNDNRHGWYKTSKEAQTAIDKYHELNKKEDSMSTETIEIEKEMEQVLRKFINGARMFTVLDITKEVKHTIPTINHKTVKEFIHNAYDSGLMDVISNRQFTTVHYTRKLIPVGNPEPWLYYHADGYHNPDDYIKNNVIDTDNIRKTIGKKKNFEFICDDIVISTATSPTVLKSTFKEIRQGN